MNWKKLLVSALMLAVSVCGIADAQAGTKRADKFKADVLYLCKEQASDPSTPATGTAGLYCKTDGRWYLIDDAGNVLKVGDATTLEDADGDTLVQVEESADEDIIRFDVAGSQKARIDSTGLGVLNDSPSEALDVTGKAQASVEIRSPSNQLMHDLSTENGLIHTHAINNTVSATETIFTATVTGTNGFNALIKVDVTGHTGSVGNWAISALYNFNGSTVELIKKNEWFQSDSTRGTLAVAYAANDITVDLTSANGTSSFKGVAKMEFMIPDDFNNNTVTFSE